MNSVYWNGRCDAVSKVNPNMVKVGITVYTFLAIVVGSLYSYITHVAVRHVTALRERVRGGGAISLRRSSFKAVKLFLAVYSVFILCWIPFFVLNEIGTPLAKLFAIGFAFLSSGLNFFVYMQMNPDFRAGVRHLCFAAFPSNRVADSFVHQ